MKRYLLIFAGCLVGAAGGLFFAQFFAGFYLGFLWLFVYGDGGSGIFPPYTSDLFGSRPQLILHAIIIGVLVLVPIAIGVLQGAKFARVLHTKLVSQGKNITIILCIFYIIVVVLVFCLYSSAEQYRIREEQQRIQKEVDMYRGCQMLRSLPIISTATARILPDARAVDIGITLSGLRKGKYAIEVAAIASSKNKTIHTFTKDVTTTSFPVDTTIHIPAAPLIKTWQEKYFQLYDRRPCDSLDFIVTLRPYFDVGQAPSSATPNDCGAYRSYDGISHWQREDSHIEGQSAKWYIQHEVWYEDQLTATLCPNSDHF